MPGNKNFSASPSRGGRSLDSSQTGKNSGDGRIDSILNLENLPLRRKSADFSSSKVEATPARTGTPAPDGPARPFTVLIADDHPVVREGLISLINRQPDMRVVAQASNGRDAVEKFIAHRPDVALVDLRMPTMDGVETVMSICECDPGARIGIITSYQNEEDIYRALRAGAMGFILKDATPEQIAGCIHAMAQGGTWIPPQVGAMLAKRVADRQLTPREIDVLRLVASGKSNKEIGVAYDISEATVKVHITHILEKLKVTGRTEAINVAVKRGLVRIDMAAAA